MKKKIAAKKKREVDRKIRLKNHGIEGQNRRIKDRKNKRKKLMKRERKIKWKR
jgi:hypothetical protein